MRITDDNHHMFYWNNSRIFWYNLWRSLFGAMMNGTVIVADFNKYRLVESFQLSNSYNFTGKEIARMLRYFIVDGTLIKDRTGFSIDDDIKLWNLASQELEETYNYDLCCGEYYANDFTIYHKQVRDIYDLLDFHKEVKCYHADVAQW